MIKMRKNKGSVSHEFKIAMVGILFMLTLLRLNFIFFFPDFEIIPDIVLLTVILFIVGYLWVQEVMDYHRLLLLNADLAQSHEQLKVAEIDTIASLVKAEEEKDEYMRGHSERVTRLAVAIAGEMGLKELTKMTIERAGILHDIGKIGISDAILHKVEKLTNEEWDIIKSHPEKAYKILAPLKFLTEERGIIISHHERYDGTGYPRGLKSSEIRIEALILAVADAFDAMNSNRSYRRPLDRDVIISELKKSADTQHSKTVVDSLFRLLERKPEFWKR